MKSITSIFNISSNSNANSASGVKSQGRNIPTKSAAEIAAEKAAEKAAKEKKLKNDIIKHQRELLKKEINQTWRVAMGDVIPKKKKDTFLIKNVTRRNVWFENDFLFNAIKRQFPEDKTMHPINAYILKWQPPNSNFQIIVPLDDPALQENAILVMSKLLPTEQKKVVFLCSTIDPTLPLFPEWIHPSALVSYRTKGEVLKRLTQFFLEGKLTEDEMNQIFSSGYEVWRPALYNLLQPDEQEYHQYLNDKLIIETNKPPNKSYLDGDITLKDFDDLTFPDRKKRKDLESLDYPQPFEGSDCIICGKEKAGIIQCHTCKNMVCKACVKEAFQDPTAAPAEDDAADKATKQKEPFLLMHHKYCMKLGELLPISVERVDDLAYLREFRECSRESVLFRFSPFSNMTFEDELDRLGGAGEEEAEAKRLAEQRAREAAEAEAKRLAAENPVELQEHRKTFEERKKKFEKYRKDINHSNAKISDESHTEQFISREKRLKAETVKKLQKQVIVPLEALLEELQQMEIPGNFLPALVRETNEIIDLSNALSE